MATTDAITIENLRKELSYDPDTGIIKRIVKKGNRAAGSVAGRIGSDGHIQLGVLKKELSGHRVAWALHYGVWPSMGIDHINGNPIDNRICNLREVSQLLNTHNRKKANKGTRSGLLGASWKTKIKRWVAQIRYQGRLVHIGYFETAHEAHEAYMREKRKFHEGMV